MKLILFFPWITRINIKRTRIQMILNVVSLKHSFMSHINYYSEAIMCKQRKWLMDRPRQSIKSLSVYRV